MCSVSVCTLKALYTVLVIAIATILITFASLIYSQMLQNQNPFNSVIQNWSNDPIINVIVQTKSQGSVCPSGWSPLLSYTWDGTVAGCNCKVGRVKAGQCCNSARRELINTQQCDENFQDEAGFQKIHQLEFKNKQSRKILQTVATSGACEGCSGQTVNAQPQTTLYNWGVQLHGVLLQSFNICIERLTNFDFILNAPQSGNCPQYLRSCGSQASLYCVPVNSPCPITQLHLGKLPPPGYLTASQQQIAINQTNSSLYYLRDEGNSLPLSDTRIAEGAGVCLQSSQDNIAIGHTEYILMREQRTPCSTLDTRYTLLASNDSASDGTLNELNFYSVNNLAQLPQVLPQYNLSTQWQYAAYTRTYFQLALVCRSYLPSFLDCNQNFDQLNQASLALLILSIMFGIYLIFCESWVQYLDIVGGGDEYYGFVVWRKTSLLTVTLFSFKFLLMLAILPCIIFLYLRYTKIMSLLQNIQTKNCLDAITIQPFNILLQNFSSAQIYVYFVFWLLQWVIEPHLVALFTTFIKQLVCCSVISQREVSKQAQGQQSFELSQNKNLELPVTPSAEIQLLNTRNKTSEKMEQMSYVSQPQPVIAATAAIQQTKYASPNQQQAEPQEQQPVEIGAQQQVIQQVAAAAEPLATAFQQSTQQNIIQYGDLVVFFGGMDKMKLITVTKGGYQQNENGVFMHDSFVGREYGCKVVPKGKGQGFAYILRSDCVLVTESILHRTQILYQTDISLILFKLNILPGSIVVESGTGSASLSQSILATLQGQGHLYTFEFNEGRADNARTLFKTLGYSNVDVTLRDVLSYGFKQREGETYALTQCDSVFLDLPETFSAIQHGKEVLRRGGKMCCFSPCIEQVQKNCLELMRLGFIAIETIEVLMRKLERRQKQFLKPFEVNETNVKRKHDEALSAASENKDSVSKGAPFSNRNFAATNTTSTGQKIIPGHTGYLTFAVLP